MVACWWQGREEGRKNVLMHKSCYDPPPERQISPGGFHWRLETGVEVIFSLSQDRNDMSRLTTNIHNSHIIHRAGSGTGQQNLR